MLPPSYCFDSHPCFCHKWMWFFFGRRPGGILHLCSVLWERLKWGVGESNGNAATPLRWQRFPRARMTGCSLGSKKKGKLREIQWMPFLVAVTAGVELGHRCELREWNNHGKRTNVSFLPSYSDFPVASEREFQREASPKHSAGRSEAKQKQIEGNPLLPDGEEMEREIPKPLCLVFSM